MAYDTGFSRRSNSERDLQTVAITSVDPQSRLAVGTTRNRTTVRINCAYATGDTISVPAVGEQWYVERFANEWRLYGRIPFNDATLNIEPEEGQVSVGSATGPLELNGTEVRANAPVFRLNGVYYRDTGVSLERSKDKLTWAAIGAGGMSGVVQVISEALAHYEGSDETAAVAALKDWSALIQGSVDNFDAVWNLACGNVFIGGLKRLGIGGTDAEKVIDGFQNFTNYLFGTLFCDFQGDLTPQTLLAQLRDLLAPVTSNPFIVGLQQVSEALGVGAGNLLNDAITGATGLVELLFNIISCNWDAIDLPQVADILALVGDGTTFGPATIVQQVFESFNFLRTNPLLTGLQGFIDLLGESTGSALQDIVNGANRFVEVLFGVLFCDASVQPDLAAIISGATGGGSSPDNVIKVVGQIVNSLADNPFIQGLVDLAATLDPGGIDNFMHNAVTGAVEFVKIVTGVLTCDPTELARLASLVGATAPGTATPLAVLASLGEVASTLLNNTWVQFVTGIANYLNVPGGLIQQILGGLSGFLDWMLGLLKTLVPFVPWQQIIDNLTLPDPTEYSALSWLSVDGIDGWLENNVFSPFRTFLNGLLGGDLATFFENLRTGVFFGIDFFPEDGVFDVPAAATAVVTNLLNQATDFLNAGLIPNLSLDKVTDLALNLTGLTGAGIDDVEKFFTNLRKFFGSDLVGGGINFLDAAFNPVNAVNAFITNVLNQATQKLGAGLIPTLDVSKIGNLVEALTGQATTGTLSAELTAVKDFFSGLDGSGGLVNQLVGQITGGGSTLTDLGTFFGDFNPLADGGLLGQVVQAMTGDASIFTTPGPLKTLSDLFAGVNTTGSLVSQVTASLTGIASSLDIATMVASITGINLVELTNSYKLAFTGTPTGGTFTLTYDGSTTSAITYSTTAETTRANIQAALVALTPIGAGNATVTVASGVFTVSISNTDGTLALGTSSLTGGTSPTLTIEQKFLGAIPALASFFSGFGVFTGANNLLEQAVTAAGSNVKTLVSKITGIAEGTPLLVDTAAALTALDNFFDGFDVFSGTTTGGNTLVNQIVKKVLGGDGTLKSLADLGTFFTNLRDLFGYTSTAGFSGFNATTAVTNLIGKIGASTTKLAATAINDLGVNQITNLVSYVTGSGTNTDTTLRNFFSGLNGQTAVGTGLASKLSEALTGRASSTTPLADIGNFLGIGATGTTTLFAPYTGAAATTMLSQLVAKITGNASYNNLGHLGTFFTNLTAMFPTISFAVGTLNKVTAANDFVTNVLSKATAAGVGTNLIPAGILSNLGMGQVTNLIGYITGTGTTPGDVDTFFKNTRAFLGFNPLGAGDLTEVANLKTAVENFFAKLNGSGSATKLNLDLLPGIGVDKITNLVKKITGSDTNTVATLETFFGGFSAHGGTTATSLASQLSAALTGKSASTTPLDDIGKFLGITTGFGGLAAFDGTAAKSLIGQVVGKFTDTGTTLTDLNTFATNLRDFLGFNPFTIGSLTALTGGVPTNLVTAASNFIGKLNSVTPTARLSPTLLQDLDVTKITGLVQAITGQGTTNTIGAVTNFFGGLTGFDGTANTLVQQITKAATGKSGGTLADIGKFLGLNDGATTTNGVLAYDGTAARGLVGQLVNQITGTGTTLTHLNSFGTNLVAFLGFNPYGGYTDLASAVTAFFTKLNSATPTTLLNPAKIGTTVSGVTTTLVTELSNRPLLTNLRNWLTVNDAGASESIQKFFTNLRAVTGLGATDLTTSVLTGTPLTTAQTAFYDVFKNLNATAQDFITKGLLGDWLKGTNATDLTVAEIGNFFKNLGQFFKIADFKLAPGAFTVSDVAGNFIRDVINQASVTGTLISPTKVTGTGGAGTTLSGDISARPILTELTSWLTDAPAVGATGIGDIQRTFTNLRAVLGLGSPTSIATLKGTTLTGTALTDAQKLIHGVVSAVNGGLSGADATKLATQVAVNGKAAIDELVRAVTGGTSATPYTNLDVLTTFGTNLKRFLGNTNFLADPTAFTAGLPGVLNTFAKTFIGAGNAKLLNSYLVGIIGTPAAGSFRLAYGDQVTAPITWNATPATLAASTQSALNLLTNIGTGGSSVTVNTSATGGTTVALNVRIDNLTAPLTLSANNLTVTSGTVPTIQVLQQTDPTFIPVLDVTKVGNLIKLVTGSDTNTTATLQNFFAGLGSGGTLSSTSLLGQIAAKITGSTGSIDLTSIDNLFVNLRAFLGFNPLNSGLNDPNPVVALANLTSVVNTFIGKLAGVNTASLTNFLPGGLLATLDVSKIGSLVKNVTGSDTNTAAALLDFFSGLNHQGTAASTSMASKLSSSLTGKVGSTTPLDDIKNFLGLGAAGTGGVAAFTGGNSLVNQLVTQVTGTGTTLPDLKKFSDNLQRFLGFNPFLADLLNADPTTAATKLAEAVSSFIAKVNGATGLTSLLDVGKVGTGTTNLTTLVTGGGVTLQNFFAGLGGTGTLSSTSLLGQITSKITGSTSNLTLTDISNLFTNLRKLLGFTSTAPLLAAPATFASQLATYATAFYTTFLSQGRTFANLQTALGGTNLNVDTATFAATTATAANNLISFINGGTGVTKLDTGTLPLETILPTSGSGISLARTSTTPVPANGQYIAFGGAVTGTETHKFSEHGGFYQTNSDTLNNSGITPGGTAGSYDGTLTVSKSGWYMAEVGFRINPTTGTLGFNAAPVLYRNGQVYKVGTDIIQTSTRTGRFAQSSFIVYLTEGQSVSSGYSTVWGSGVLGFSFSLSKPNFIGTSNGAETYFSLTLLSSPVT